MDKKSNKKYFNIILILVLGATVIYFTMKDDLHASFKSINNGLAFMDCYFLCINVYIFFY